MSTFTQSKADRLLADGKVQPHLHPAQVFEVDGDSDRHLVTITTSVQLCTCPSKTTCSHIEAALRWVLADAEQRARNEDALEARKARDRVAADAVFAKL